MSWDDGDNGNALPKLKLAKSEYTHMQMFKIVLDGARGTGKTSFIRRQRTGEFSKKYITTLGCEIHLLTFQTTKGQIVLEVWDLAGYPKFRGLGCGYYQGVQGMVLFCDPDQPVSVETIKEVKEAFVGVPTVICMSKADLGHETLANPIPDSPFYVVSSRSNYNLEKPFLRLM
jgi:GTPase SAR1 family protein